MSRYQDESEFRHDAPPCTGVLLVNLGTPESPDTAAVRRYLAEFLWDPRLVEMPRPLWWTILHGAILRLRPARLARAYRSIWSEEGSPLLVIGERLQAALQRLLEARIGGRVVTALAMRYGQPSIERALDGLRRQGMRRLLVLPLYPQYSATTTASVFDEVTRVLQQWRWLPELRFVLCYHDRPAYIEALANSVREHWQQHGRAQRLLMSFHGIPRRYFAAGDPYYCACQKTARLLAEKLGLEEGQWQLTFQSRFGREEWLQPYTDYTLRSWARQGIESVDVICPGFSADCLETLEEIAQQDRELFLANGGREYRYIAALNDRPDHVEALARLIETNLQGWVGDGAAEQDRLAGCLERARALGAPD